MDLLHLFHNDHGEWSAVAAFIAGFPAIRAFVTGALARLRSTSNSSSNPSGTTGEE
jgi:hypothetical protein